MVLTLNRLRPRKTGDNAFCGPSQYLTWPSHGTTKMTTALLSNCQADVGNGCGYPAIDYSVFGINMFYKKSKLISEPIFLQE